MPRTATDEAQPQYKVTYREIQPFGTLKTLPLGLPDKARAQSVTILNQVLADAARSLQEASLADFRRDLLFAASAARQTL
jgi:hypothetical protein